MVLYLLGEKGFLVLEHIIKTFGVKSIDFVIIGKDKNVIEDYANHIENICQTNHIKYFYKNNAPNDYEAFAISVGWRWIIQNVKNLIVLHDSLLPKYRGFAPLVNSLLNGESTLGVSALFASDNYDRGNIICQYSIDVTYPIKICDAIKRISECYIECVTHIIELIQTNPLFMGSPQNEIDASYSLWRDECDYFIDWKKKSTYIKRFVDSVGFPYGGAKTKINDIVYIIEDVEVITDVYIESRDDHIGKVIFMEKDDPVVVCGDGLIKITEMLDLSRSKKFNLDKFRVRFQ